MNTISVDLKPETARIILDMLIDQRDTKIGEVQELDDQIQRIRTALEESSGSRPKTFQISLNHQASIAAPPKTPHGRAKKGASKGLIRDFLKVRNGEGATIKEISSATGTVYGTARRILKEFEKERKIKVENGNWHWLLD